MSRIVHRTRRDLREIADHAPISSTARSSILVRAGAPLDPSEREAVMLENNTYRPPRTAWHVPVAVGIAAVAALAVAGIVIVRSGGDDAGEVATVDSAPGITEDDVSADEPSDDNPAIEDPAAGPAADDSATVIDEPAVDEPAADEPVTDAPAVIDEPTVDGLEQLAALPWASPDDLNSSPAEAVTAFVEFLAAEYGTLPTEDVDGRPLEAFEGVTIGDFIATGDGTGTVAITQNDWSLGDAGQVHPITTVDLQQAGPDDSWWVVRAASDTMRIDAPTAGSELPSTFPIVGTNPIISDAVRLHVFTAGEHEPLLETFLTGGGVFAWGDILADIDLRTAPGTPGTLVVMTSTQVATIPVVFTGEAAPGVAPGRPWHPAGSAHDSPVAAVEEFLTFAGFGEDAALRDFGTMDGLGTFVVDADPDPQPDFLPAYDPDDPQSHRDTTSINVRLDPNGHWVVTGATTTWNLGVDLHGAPVSSPMRLDVEHTVAGWGVTAELWPDGATAPISEVVITEGADPLAAQTFSTTMTWDADVQGPATLIVTSHDRDCDGQGCDDPSGAIAVTTVRVRIDG